MKNNKAAFLWDESFLWGLMAYRALRRADLGFDLVRAADIKDGVPDKYSMLFVPGGWASNKSRALGDEGAAAIRSFVERGGNYLGFCGGAGLATKAKGCIGLMDVRRRPTKERVPSFSGRIHLNIIPHPVWSGIRNVDACGGDVCHVPSPPVFHAWWPSQFIVDESVKVLASYGTALPDAFSSDLNVGDVERTGGWDELEDMYRINLNPARLMNEPAVLEGRYGKGKVVLSLIHFDTPGDVNGTYVLKKLWEYLGGGPAGEGEASPGGQNNADGNAEDCGALNELCAELIRLGERNFLWFWRNSMLLQWRRGVRGLEYNTLYIMTKEIADIMARGDAACKGFQIGGIRDRLAAFTEKAGRLLLIERRALQSGHITYLECDDPEIKKIRSELFSESKSYGGMFKDLLDEIDGLLYLLIEQ